METRLSEHQEKVRVTSYRAGNITTQFDLDVTPEEFDTALRDAIQPNDRSHRVELPGSILEIDCLADGVRISLHEAKRPQRTSTKLTWLDFCRYLISE